MAITRNLTITDEAYQAITKIKGTLSYSFVVLDLVKEHHELVNMKLEQKYAQNR
jgi:predicted CopG family antitoxin